MGLFKDASRSDNCDGKNPKKHRKGMIFGEKG